jgi:hypothetical protein
VLNVLTSGLYPVVNEISPLTEKTARAFFFDALENKGEEAN